MTSVFLTALAVAPLLFLLGQAPLRRHRLLAVEREFFAHWSRLSPAEKAAVLARAGEPPTDPDAAALGLVRRAWTTMQKSGDFDVHRLRAYCESLVRAAKAAT